MRPTRRLRGLSGPEKGEQSGDTYGARHGEQYANSHASAPPPQKTVLNQKRIKR
jgi:hypothetical protein